MSESDVRAVGSGWTVFQYRQKTIALATSVQETAPRPVASAVEVQGIDDEHPREIVTPRAVTGGSLNVTMYELWNQEIWQSLPGGDFANARDLLEIFKRQVELSSITVSKIIKAPDAKGGFRQKNYYNCKITNVQEGETVTKEALVVPKSMTIQYTHCAWV